MADLMIEEVFTIFEKLEKLDPEDNEKEWDALEDKIAEAPVFDDLTQDQMVKFLEHTRMNSWDIPSALMSICSHLEEDEYFWMHRPIYKWVGPHSDVKNFIVDDEATHKAWDPADAHFKEVHGWDMTDKRINWSFDT